MKASGDISGLTLFEMVLAVAVLAVLVSIVVGVGNYTLTQARTRLAESTVSILVTAIEQYHDFTGTFPPECNDLASLEDALEGSFDDSFGVHLPEFSSSEVLYYYLNRVPESRRIIGAISDSLTTNLDENESDAEVDRILKFDPKQDDVLPFSLIRFIDPWGKSFRYEYDVGDNFPEITSAGPDKDFDKRDDNIASRGI